MSEEQQQAYRHRSTVDHAFHVWINQRQDERHKAGQPWEHDLYEWKSALAEMERLPHWLKRARTETLPVIHQQCSRQEPEPIAENRLLCALGVDVVTCPILASLYGTFTEEADQAARMASRGYRSEAVTLDDADAVAGRVCGWHIFMEKLRHPNLDTSEGYVKDESDRRFWSNVYESLSRSADDDDDDEGEPDDDDLPPALEMWLSGAAPLPGIETP